MVTGQGRAGRDKWAEQIRGGREGKEGVLGPVTR